MCYITNRGNYRWKFRDWIARMIHKTSGTCLLFFPFDFMLCWLLCIVFDLYMTDPIYLIISRIFYYLSSDRSCLSTPIVLFCSNFSRKKTVHYGWSSHYDGTEPILKMAVRDFCTNVPSTQIEDQKEDDDRYISIPRMVLPVWSFLNGTRTYNFFKMFWRSNEVRSSHGANLQKAFFTSYQDI